MTALVSYGHGADFEFFYNSRVDVDATKRALLRRKTAGKVYDMQSTKRNKPLFLNNDVFSEFHSI